MFMIISCKEQREGLSRLFSRQEYYIDTVNEGQVQFMTLTIKGGRKINWERLHRILGERRQNVLLQKELSPPAELMLSPPDPLPYARRMTKNAAEKILRRAKDKRENRVLLIDERLEFQEEAEMILRYCDKLTVLTDRLEQYPVLPPERINLLPLGQEAGLMEHTMIFAPRLPTALAEASNRFGQTPVLTASADELSGFPGTVMTAFTAPLPQRYVAFLPECIDEYSFAAALYTCCGITDIGETIPERCDIYQFGKIAARHVAF